MFLKKNVQQPKYTRQTKIEILNDSDEYLEFLLTDSDISFANALRRIMISEIPTLAIDVVTVEENTTSLQDEFIVHRLGLLPIDSNDIDKYETKEKCSCVGTCNNCTVKYQINVVAPPDKPYNLTHHDIMHRPEAPKIKIYNSKSFQNTLKKYNLKDNGIIIAKLAPSQQFSAEFTACKGIGKIHTKWSPVGTATFRHIPEIRINESFQGKVKNIIKRHIVMKSRKGLFKLFDEYENVEIDVNYNFDESRWEDYDYKLIVDDPMKYRLDSDIEQILKESNFEDYIEIKLSQNKFFFKVESVGNFRAIQILSRALAILYDKLTEIETSFLQQPATIGVLGSDSTGYLDLK